jgi:replicative DNA helicase
MTQLAKYTIAADALADWNDDLLSGKPPTLYNVGRGDLSRIEIGPGRVVLIGGVPGGGKTALATQLTFDALRTTPGLRAVVANVEMTPAVLLDRQLARVSGIPLDAITHRRLDATHAERLDMGIATLEPIGDRLAFVQPPFDLGNIAAVVDAIDADLIVLDYVQRIRPPGEHADRRGSVDALMDCLRQFADAGKALVCVAAVARSKDKGGRSSYDGDALNLASFRESSELEYGADSAYILIPGDDDAEAVTLRCLKHRHGEPRDIALRFERARQRFIATNPSEVERMDLAARWNSTPEGNA